VPSRVRNPVFDQLFDAALPDVLAGTHQRDVAPLDGGRWPVTVVARPPRTVRTVLEQLMRDSLQWAGGGHFVTGREDSVHLTIRALEPYREAAAPTDEIVGRWRAAIDRACAAVPPLELAVTGVTLSSAGVMAQVEPSGAGPWQFMERLHAELGELAWFEDQWRRRNIWYATLVHFADDILDPTGLVDWVREHRTIAPVQFTINEVELVRFRHVAAAADGERLMRPETWFAVRPMRG
jgi:hypothetical protein